MFPLAGTASSINSSLGDDDAPGGSLLSRIRERWRAGASNDAAVAQGLQHTGRIITSAALPLCVVFAGFLVAGFVPVKAIGLGLVLAVALDATIVRLLLVPATMTLLGAAIEWLRAAGFTDVRAEGRPAIAPTVAWLVGIAAETSREQ